MRLSTFSAIFFSFAIPALKADSAHALVRLFSSRVSMAEHGWIPPGGSVKLSTTLTANVPGIPTVRVGYALIERATDREVASGVKSLTPALGAPIELSLTIPIPGNAPQGKYRAELRVLGATGDYYWREPRAVCFAVTTQQPHNNPKIPIPVRGCSELPFSTTQASMNYLYASGSQLVDAKGTPLKISAINWFGTDGGPGYASQGLWTLNYQRVMESIKSEGFNAIRVSWTDDILYARPREGDMVYGAQNKELWEKPPTAGGVYTFKKTIDIFQIYADYAAKIGLKIFFEHHENRGVNTTGNQQNGLWFSKDLSRDYCSDGTYVRGVDGKELQCDLKEHYDCDQNTGLVTKAYPHFGRCSSQEDRGKKFTDYQAFKQNTLALAKKFAGHPAVIGFELHNEPWAAPVCEPQYAWMWCSRMPINWGVSNDAYDLRWVAKDIGDAILAVNPDALLLVEPYDDLKNVAKLPIQLSNPSKLVYAVHVYPQQVNNVVSNYEPPDYMAPFGFLVARNIAPVTVTEMGACIGPYADPTKTTDEEIAEEIAKEKLYKDGVKYLTRVTSFLNGEAFGGISTYANRQGMGTAWTAATLNDVPDCKELHLNGMWTAWPTGDFVPFKLSRPATLDRTDQLLFQGSGDVSADNTVVGLGGSIIDPDRHVFAVLKGRVAVDGVVDARTANAVTVAFAGGRVCYLDASGRWFCKGASGWVANAVSPLRASPAGFVSVEGGPPIIDGKGNYWSLGDGWVMVNGQTDPVADPKNDKASPRIVQLAYVQGLIWRMDASGAWSSKGAPAAKWAAAASSPLPASTATKVITEGGGAIVDAKKNTWAIVGGEVIVNGLFDSIMVNKKVEHTTERVIELVYQGGRIWQKNADWLWWSKVKTTDKWSPAGGQSAGPPLAVSPNGAVVTPGGGSLVTASGEHWTISGGKIIADGVVDEITENVLKLAYYNGKIWQQNADGLWWSKAKFFDAWSPPGGSATKPF